MRGRWIVRKSTWWCVAALALMLAFPLVSQANVPYWEQAQPGEARDLPRPEPASKRYTIGVALPHLANPHFVAQAYGYYDEAEALGVDIVLLEAGGYQYLDRQVDQVEDLLALPVDALIIVAVSADGTKPIVDMAAETGIPVINVNVMTASEKVVTRIRSEDEEIGRLQAQYAAEALGCRGNVMVLAGPAGTSWAIGRSKGYIEYMQENCPDIRILDTRWLQSDPAAGMREMEDVLLAYPNELDGVMTGSDFLGVGAAQAAFAAGMSDRLVITTSDSQPDALQMIRDGRINATVVQAPVIMGRWGIRAAVMALEGRAHELKKQYWTPLHVVDRETVDTFEYVGVSMPPEGWKLP